MRCYAIMAICGTISAPCARSRVKNFRRARSRGADGGFPSFRPAFCRRCSGLLAKSNFQNRQSLVASAMAATDTDINSRPISGAIGDRFGRLPAGGGFFGRCESQGAMLTGGVAPPPKNIKPALNRHLRSPPAVGGYYSPRLEFLE